MADRTEVKYGSVTIKVLNTDFKHVMQPTLRRLKGDIIQMGRTQVVQITKLNTCWQDVNKLFRVAPKLRHYASTVHSYNRNETIKWAETHAPQLLCKSSSSKRSKPASKTSSSGSKRRKASAACSNSTAARTCSKAVKACRISGALLKGSKAVEACRNSAALLKDCEADKACSNSIALLTDSNGSDYAVPMEAGVSNSSSTVGKQNSFADKDSKIDEQNVFPDKDDKIDEQNVLPVKEDKIDEQYLFADIRTNSIFNTAVDSISNNDTTGRSNKEAILAGSIDLAVDPQRADEKTELDVSPLSTFPSLPFLYTPDIICKMAEIGSFTHVRSFVNGSFQESVNFNRHNVPAPGEGVGDYSALGYALPAPVLPNAAYPSFQQPGFNPWGLIYEIPKNRQSWKQKRSGGDIIVKKNSARWRARR